MKLACEQVESAGAEWCEAIGVAFGFGRPALFNLEWLFDEAERGEWGGLWW